MTEFKSFTDSIIALPQKDIDTDAIIPAQFLTTTERAGLGEHVFYNLKKSDPDFPEINRSILVTGKNFGCGSSREHAVWALKEAGIRAVIASEFADIFRGNAEKNQLLTIVLPESVVGNILLNQPKLTISLEGETVWVEGTGDSYGFEISDFIKQKFLHNVSDLDYLLSRKAKIEVFGRK